MPNPGSPIQLRKVTLNLNEEDIFFLEAYYGWGWSQIVRDEVHLLVTNLKRKRGLKTLGDLE